MSDTAIFLFCSFECFICAVAWGRYGDLKNSYQLLGCLFAISMAVWSLVQAVVG
jgi:hypothetical protein